MTKYFPDIPDQDEVLSEGMVDTPYVSKIEAPLITLPETYFLSVIMAADAQARPFLQFQASR